MFLVPPFDLKFLNELAADGVGTQIGGTSLSRPRHNATMCREGNGPAYSLRLSRPFATLEDDRHGNISGRAWCVVGGMGVEEDAAPVAGCRTRRGAPDLYGPRRACASGAS